jgi:hypothetical protein
MRFILLVFILCLVYCCSQKAELAEQLQSRHWYVQARNWEADRTAVFSTDSTQGHDWEAIFYPGGKMFYAATFPFNFYDSKGVKHLKGERFTDSTYSYKINGNILRVSKEKEVYYLKFQPQPGNRFTITPAEEEEFE